VNTISRGAAARSATLAWGEQIAQGRGDAAVPAVFAVREDLHHGAATDGVKIAADGAISRVASICPGTRSTAGVGVDPLSTPIIAVRAL
jgi:hypothetical protein